MRPSQLILHLLHSESVFMRLQMLKITMFHSEIQSSLEFCRTHLEAIPKQHLLWILVLLLKIWKNPFLLCTLVPEQWRCKTCLLWIFRRITMHCQFSCSLNLIVKMMKSVKCRLNYPLWWKKSPKWEG